jgi:hypothetical protein
MILSYTEHSSYQINAFEFLSFESASKLKEDIKTVVLDIRRIGIKQSFKKHGLKLVLIVFFYYLIRDTFLYLILPYYLLKS